MKKVKIAAVEARTIADDDYFIRNIEYAQVAVQEAAKNGADIICFPETFPGPRTEKDIHLDAFEEISYAARTSGRYIVYGAATDAGEGRQYISEILVGPDGKKIGQYNRNCPPGPWIYRTQGRTFWDLDYLEGDSLPVFETDIGTIGLLVCSEVYMPELSRILAIKGAEITFLPAGTFKCTLYDTWRILLQARAIENLMYTVSCDNLLYGQETPGLAMIAGPEGEFRETNKEGIIYMDADIERVRWLRKAKDTVYATYEDIPYYSKPGVLEQWRRPEVFGELLNKV